MPRGNGTGPAGWGPMTGRAAGFCAGYPVPGYMNPIPGRGFYGRGSGWFGRGIGRGRGFFGRGRGGGFVGWGLNPYLNFGYPVSRIAPYGYPYYP